MYILPVAYVFDNPQMVKDGARAGVRAGAGAGARAVARAVAGAGAGARAPAAARAGAGVRAGADVDAAVVDLAVFAIIHVVFVGVCAVARDCCPSTNGREANESLDLECETIEDMINRQPSLHDLVAAMDLSLAAWLTAMDSN